LEFGMSSTLTERRELVHGQYDHLWDQTHQKAVKLIERGERNLARIHRLMRRDFGEEFDDPALKEKGRKREEQRRATGFLYDRQLVRFYDVETRVNTVMLDALKMQEIVNVCTGAGRVLELGAGWGKNLFNVWLHGGPRDAEYHALELTESGRRTGALVASTAAAGMRYSAHAFDYYEPDFSQFRDNVPTVVFTHHSLEQIPEVSERLIAGLLALPGFRTCVHLEPVGFQVPGDRWLAVPDDAQLRSQIEDENRRFAQKRNQNANLYPLLARLEQQRRLRLRVVRKFICSTVLANATTLLVWEPWRDDAASPDPSRRDDLAASLPSATCGPGVTAAKGSPARSPGGLRSWAARFWRRAA
jgi:hypothetical protein